VTLGKSDSKGEEILFAKAVRSAMLPRSKFGLDYIVNAELCKKALEKVGSPNVLINIVSRRVRQLNAGGGGMGRPLIADYTNLDIALREIIEEKIGWEIPELEELHRPVAKKRKKH
jgi:DNA-directed RNA polymerase subunit omega